MVIDLTSPSRQDPAAMTRGPASTARAAFVAYFLISVPTTSSPIW
jgi:hypothetical protein